MITIEDKVNNIKINLLGKIKRVPSLRGFIRTETALGFEKTESTKGVINLQLIIHHIDESSYKDLEVLFLCSSTFDIIDSASGGYYKDYYIDGDILELEEKEDGRTELFYYDGNLNIRKR